MEDMSENDFYNVKGDSYRGSRYSNFVGGGTDPQGNVSSAIAENASSGVGTNASPSDAPPTPATASQGLTSDIPSTKDMVIGAALPYAGQAVGQAAGTAIQGAGATFSEGVSQGFSSLANTASGGLIGTASTPTNVAISGMGGKFGPATKSAVDSASAASNVGKLGSGANLGAAAGAGFATAAATLLTGGSVKDAVKSGGGTAVGTAIGNAVAGPIGGFVGGFIGGTVFCFVDGTPVIMADGSHKNVEDIKLGDDLLLGGKVFGVGTAYCDEIVNYKNAVLSAKHAVFEDGKWLRAEESEHSIPIEVEGQVVVYPIVCANNVLCTPWFISADVFEVPEEMQEGLTSESAIEWLNSQVERNEWLRAAERQLVLAKEKAA